MSRLGTASNCSFGAWVAGLMLLVPAATARAQTATRLLLIGQPQPPPANVARWQRLLAQRAGPITLDAVAWASASPPAIDPERLLILQRVEQLLAQARGEARALAEDQALVSLAQAATLSEGLADVPGVVAWQAEIQLRIGATAAQAGLHDLAEVAFRRVTALEPTRRLLQAEAPPAVVEQCERVARQLALAPSGQFEVRVAAPSAQVYLDDQLRGAAPARLRARVGRHVLRVEAPGYLAYGASIDVLEGERPPMQIIPAPNPALDAAWGMGHAVDRGDYHAIEAALRGLPRSDGPTPAVLALQVSADARRALLVRCDAGGCRGPTRLRLDGAPWRESNAALTLAMLERDRSWLAQAWQARAPTRWWRRWYVWSSVLAVSAAAAASVWALSDRQAPAPRLRVVVDTAAAAVSAR